MHWIFLKGGVQNCLNNKNKKNAQFNVPAAHFYMQSIIIFFFSYRYYCICSSYETAFRIKGHRSTQMNTDLLFLKKS